MSDFEAFSVITTVTLIMVVAVLSNALLRWVTLIYYMVGASLQRPGSDRVLRYIVKQVYGDRHILQLLRDLLRRWSFK